MSKGEVWRVRLAWVPGPTQGGERPAVIIPNDPFIASLPTVLIVPFTSAQASTRFAGTILLQPDGRNGLNIASVALVFQISAVDKGNLPHRLGALAQQTLDQILALLTKLTA